MIHSAETFTYSNPQHLY